MGAIGAKINHGQIIICLQHIPHYTAASLQNDHKIGKIQSKNYIYTYIKNYFC